MWQIAYLSSTYPNHNLFRKALWTENKWKQIQFDLLLTKRKEPSPAFHNK